MHRQVSEQQWSCPNRFHLRRRPAAGSWQTRLCARPRAGQRCIYQLMEVAPGDERGAVPHCVLRLSRDGEILAADVPPGWPFAAPHLVGRTAAEMLPSGIFDPVSRALTGISGFDCVADWSAWPGWADRQDAPRVLRGIVAKEQSGDALLVLY